MHEQQEPADVSSRQHANELVKLIRKLRWMGMQEEAERVQMRLAQCPVPAADSVLATPHDTD
jgi:predicted ArsR family transcriptional regulator